MPQVRKQNKSSSWSLIVTPLEITPSQKSYICDYLQNWNFINPWFKNSNHKYGSKLVVKYWRPALSIQVISTVLLCPLGFPFLLKVFYQFEFMIVRLSLTWPFPPQTQLKEDPPPLGFIVVLVWGFRDWVNVLPPLLFSGLGCGGRSKLFAEI